MHINIALYLCTLCVSGQVTEVRFMLLNCCFIEMHRNNDFYLGLLCFRKMQNKKQKKVQNVSNNNYNSSFFSVRNRMLRLLENAVLMLLVVKLYLLSHFSSVLTVGEIHNQLNLNIYFLFLEVA